MGVPCSVNESDCRFNMLRPCLLWRDRTNGRVQVSTVSHYILNGSLHSLDTMKKIPSRPTGLNPFRNLRSCPNGRTRGLLGFSGKCFHDW